MSVHFISGKPGGGKSLYGMKLLVEELRFGTRPIYTNLPINLGRLAEYMQQTFDWSQWNINDRVRVLTDDETAYFWSYRPGVRINVLKEEQWRGKERPDYGQVKDTGVMFIIDEIHNFFNARAWAETGRDVLFYLSQHRKLGDTVICITQAIGNVDKQFRSVSQDYTYLRNLTKERYGVFNLPSMFIRRTYTSPATDTAQPMETGTFKLDVSGLASCYNTAAGVGIHGRGADTTEKKKGIPWLVLIVSIPIVVIGIGMTAPKFIAGLFAAPVSQAIKTTQSTPAQSYTTVTNGFKGFDTKVVPSTNQAPVAPAQVAGPEIFCSGYEKLTGKWRVYMDNGEVYTQGDGFLEMITENFVRIKGRNYRYKNVGVPQFRFETQVSRP